ncbi:hypothetical protein [Mycolicibacterium sp. XJ870]
MAAEPAGPPVAPAAADAELTSGRLRFDDDAVVVDEHQAAVIEADCPPPRRFDDPFARNFHRGSGEIREIFDNCAVKFAVAARIYDYSGIHSYPLGNVTRLATVNPHGYVF